MPVYRTDTNSIRLAELCQNTFANKRLFFVSNRGPVEFRFTDSGNLQSQRSGGGLMTSLVNASQNTEMVWFSSAMGEGDRRATINSQGEKIALTSMGAKLFVHFIVSPRNVYHKYYNIFCNPLLWFLQHYMWNPPYTPNIDAKVYDAWDNGYVNVNKAFASSIINEIKKDSRPSVIMTQDYHLYLVNGYLRMDFPDIFMTHFIHIPWPSSIYWELLPQHIRLKIISSLCCNDIVGLQTRNDVVNFLNTCKSFLPDAEVDFNNNVIKINNRVVQVKEYPISVDVNGLERLIQSPLVNDYRAKIRPYLSEKNIVRVDRTEPTKNIIRGFKAFDIFLQRYPEYIGKVKFLAFLVPSITHIKQYQIYNQEVLEIVKAINNKYSKNDWQPIKIYYENNYPQSIAAMSLYDVLLVNAVIDGMNLVAKEGPIVNTIDGVVILSESVGAYQQLKEGVITLTAVDIEATVNAIYKALTMPVEEKKKKAEILKTAIKKDDMTQWLYNQFQDIRSLLPESTVVSQKQ